MTSLDDSFFENFWQKKPTVLRGFFQDFVDPIDENDLAGLAQEDDIDSRIIAFDDNQWEVYHGPFDSFDEVCTGAWTLLVQHVDRYIREVNDLINPFRTIPHWRIDDIMVSYAVEDAGVGPHVDQYDVFLIQGKGSRRWRVGQPGNYPEHYPHCDLRQISDFDAILDVELNPGDVLYIPPNWPHDGKAITDCLTYSVGFRAPDSEALSQLLTSMLTEHGSSERFTDPHRRSTSQPGEIEPRDIERLKSMLHNAIESPEFDSNLMHWLSEQHLDLQPCDELNAQALQQELQAGAELIPVSGYRPIYRKESDQIAILYIDGEAFDISLCPPWLAQKLVNGETLNHDILKECNTMAIYELLSTLILGGYWLLQSP